MFENYVLPLIVTCVAIVLFVVLCTVKFKNGSEEQKLKPVRWVFWALVVCEVLKIFYLIAQNGYYDPLRYPLVFCSLVMYTYPLFCFKKNRFSRVALAYSVVPSFIVFVLFVAVQGGYKMSLIQGHSYFYHGAMMAVAVYLLTSGLYKFELKDFFPLTLALSGYVLFATFLSLFVGGDISIFGPSGSYLQFLYTNFGYAVGNLLMCVVVFFACLSVYGVVHLVTKKRVKAEEGGENV